MGTGTSAQVQRETYLQVLVAADNIAPEVKGTAVELEPGLSGTAGGSQGSADRFSNEDRPQLDFSGKGIWQWWKDTMAPEFLKSTVSKRSSWRVLFPMLGIVVVVLDVVSMILALTVSPPDVKQSLRHVHWSWSLGLDGLLLLAMVSAARLPISTVLSDAVLVVILGFYPVTYCSLLSPDSLGLQFYNIFVIFVLAHSGIHLCAIIGFWLFSLTALPVMGFRLGVLPITSGFLACFLVAVGGIALAPHIDTAFKALSEVKEEQEGVSEASARTDELVEISDPVAEDIGLPRDLSEEARNLLLREEVTNPSGKYLQTAMQNLVLDGPAPQGLATAMRSVQRARRAMDKQPPQAGGSGQQAEQIVVYTSEDGTASAITPVHSQTPNDLSQLPPSGLKDRDGRRISLHSIVSQEQSHATSSLRYSTSSEHSHSTGATGIVRRMSSFISNASPFSQEIRRSKQRVEVGHTGVQTDATGYLCKRCMRPPALPETPMSTRSISSVKGALRSLGKSGRSKHSSRGSASSISSRGGSVDQSYYNPNHLFNADPIVSCYKITPAMTVQLSLQWSMKHWNLPRIPGSCCPWHTALVVAKTSIDDLIDTDCEPLWSSLTGWQCVECTSLNHSQVKLCDMCAEPRPANTETATNTELASTFNQSSTVGQDASWPIGSEISIASASQAGSKTRSIPMGQSPLSGSWPAGFAGSASLDSKTSGSAATASKTLDLQLSP